MKCATCNTENEAVFRKGDNCPYCETLSADERIEVYTMTHSKLEGYPDEKEEKAKN